MSDKRAENHSTNIETQQKINFKTGHLTTALFCFGGGVAFAADLSI